MSFDWQNYYYLAVQLNDDVSTTPCDLESKKRAAISRAYYATLMQAQAYLIKHENFEPKNNIPWNEEEKGKDSHKDIIKEFNYKAWDRSKYPNWYRLSQTIYDNLRHLKTRRKSADYDPDFMDNNSNLTEETEEVLDKANEVLKALSELDRKPRDITRRLWEPKF